ncbi:MAG: hypothetical protein ISP22_04905 [Candidatus Actinomarina sp.]|nr:hypothetical protein [Candidatus Actinomarina sp.]
MLINLIKNNYKRAMISTFIFMLFLTNLSATSINNLVSTYFVYSFIMYFALFLITFDSFRKNKFIGIYLLVTIFFIPPNIFPNYKGLLFPITYLSFTAYVGFIVSNHIFKLWKKNHVL